MEAQPKTYHFYSWFFPGLFTTRRDEKLFLEYTTSQKQRAIPRLLVTGLLLQLYSLIVPGRLEYSIAYSLTAVATFSNLMLLTFHYTSPTRRTLNSHLSWLVIWLQLLINASLRAGDAYNELLGWAALIQYLTLATLPFSAPILILYSLLSMTAYLLVQYLNATMMGYFPEDFMEQEICNGSILVCASLLGATGFVMYENQHRRSFVETKRSLRDKLTIDQQSKEQERLLLSVLPEHVAVQMRKDLGLIDTQFKKIYMSRHENVSILYADIVGFTAISSTYSAQDLVAILNELFARFDRLSEKYQQLRIKILGDCYYCISGAPVERPDHAVLCVHMGLSMVKAIKYVQQTTNSPVDMRVGIHTGAVLAGVLGQRQWQFDVYSRDVELANKMESSGMAGRVHVSEVTLGFLKDEFEVEPAYGEKREEMLRQAGIKTYFIVKVLKPYHGDEKSGEGADEDRGDTLSDLRDEDEDSVLSAEGEKQASEDMLIYNMLEEELRNRDDSTDLLATGWCLRLRYGAERVYQCRGDTNQALLLLPPVFLLIPIAAVALLAVETRSVLLTYVAYVIVAPLATFVYYVCYMWRRSKGIQQHPEVRSMYSLVHLTMFIATGIIQLMYCGSLETQIKLHELLNQDIQPDEALRCAHPSYYYHNLEVLSIEDLEHIQPEKITQHQEAPNFCTDLEPLPSPPRFVEDTMACCCLCCGILITPASCIRRIVIIISLSSYYVIPSVWMPIVLEPRPTLDLDPYLDMQNGTIPYMLDRIFYMRCWHEHRHLLMIYLVAFTVCIFDRYLEAMERARFLRGERMRQQAEQAGDLRRRNQALVYNVLPPHVARHFMGAHRNHRDLYSQSYAEVGVLFASMPNFTEFYSEETVNNQGLECLRFLNEVISDFDTLLEDARFRDIIKIKTISSTYMAASGLNPERDVKNADTTTQRWKHLMCLVEFALELQRVLAAINEQSFNHFVLRMGVNHGPITAGVIGAKKPHYDIWGNTVNVASRMESTGKAGCIQVTEETCEILKDFGYYFEQRGLVAVKGKGQLMTYYLQGRNNNSSQEKPKAEVVEHSRKCPLMLENGSANALVSQANADQDDTVANIPLLPKKM